MMRIASPVFVFGLLLAFSAGAVAAAPQPAQQPSSAQMAARDALASHIKRGMDFTAFRQVALAQGWEPIANSAKCQQQAESSLCAKLPEIASVSSGPIEYNEMGYRDRKSGELLDIVITGDITAWGTADAKDLTVESWKFGKAPN